MIDKTDVQVCHGRVKELYYWNNVYAPDIIAFAWRYDRKIIFKGDTARAHRAKVLLTSATEYSYYACGQWWIWTSHISSMCVAFLGNVFGDVLLYRRPRVSLVRSCKRNGEGPLRHHTSAYWEHTSMRYCFLCQSRLTYTLIWRVKNDVNAQEITCRVFR